MDMFVRLSKSPVVSIAKIRGCLRGVSSEFVLPSDMRFASRENTRLGQPEVGVGVHPGGGTERLPHLVGRNGFVDALARRIASFARRAIAAAKNLIDQVSLPSADQLLNALNSFQTALK
jgi:enoyl-CoA hydratase/carnithine racemase